MKKILIIAVASIITLTTSAQRISHGSGMHSFAHATRVYIVPSVGLGLGYGYGYGYPFMGYPFLGYPFMGYPPYYGYRRSPAQLNMQIQEIKNEYHDKIKATRKDKSISKTERKQQIRNLKSEKDKEILNATMDYRRPVPRMNYQNNPGTMNQGNRQQNNNPSSNNNSNQDNNSNQGNQQQNNNTNPNNNSNQDNNSSQGDNQNSQLQQGQY